MFGQSGSISEDHWLAWRHFIFIFGMIQIEGKKIWWVIQVVHKDWVYLFSVYSEMAQDGTHYSSGHFFFMSLLRKLE